MITKSKSTYQSLDNQVKQFKKKRLHMHNKCRKCQQLMWKKTLHVRNTWKHCSTEVRFVLFDAELTSKCRESFPNRCMTPSMEQVGRDGS